jgi:hypothetical protein
MVDIPLATTDAEKAKGASGAVSTIPGIASFEGTDEGPFPLALAALTVKV